MLFSSSPNEFWVWKSIFISKVVAEFESCVGANHMPHDLVKILLVFVYLHVCSQLVYVLVFGELEPSRDPRSVHPLYEQLKRTACAANNSHLFIILALGVIIQQSNSGNVKHFRYFVQRARARAGGREQCAFGVSTLLAAIGFERPKSQRVP